MVEESVYGTCDLYGDLTCVFLTSSRDSNLAYGAYLLISHNQLTDLPSRLSSAAYLRRAGCFLWQLKNK
jgi:hypothetical protein